MFAFQTLLSKIQLAKPTDFGDLFNDSIVLFKKSPGFKDFCYNCSQF